MILLFPFKRLYAIVVHTTHKVAREINKSNNNNNSKRRLFPFHSFMWNRRLPSPLLCTMHSFHPNSGVLIVIKGHIYYLALKIWQTYYCLFLFLMLGTNDFIVLFNSIINLYNWTFWFCMSICQNKCLYLSASLFLLFFPFSAHISFALNPCHSTYTHRVYR